jgi:hypothetical protein
MKTTRTREWLMLSAFALSGALAFSIFYHFAIRFIPPPDDIRVYYAGIIDIVHHAPEQAAGNGGDRPIGRIGDTLVFQNNEALELGKSILIYRGLTRNSEFEVDVIIPAFDPRSPFPYTFTIAEAKRGFKLVNRSFRLLSATPSFLHLEQVTE